LALRSGLIPLGPLTPPPSFPNEYNFSPSSPPYRFLIFRQSAIRLAPRARSIPPSPFFPQISTLALLLVRDTSKVHLLFFVFFFTLSSRKVPGPSRLVVVVTPVYTMIFVCFSPKRLLQSCLSVAVRFFFLYQTRFMRHTVIALC